MEGRHVTAREIEVLTLLAEGFGNREIATELHISPKTIARHVEHIMQALEARSRTQAAVMAVRAGLV